jgi:hypothetical protein
MAMTTRNYEWSVSYETATVSRGTAATEQEANRQARFAHDALVCQGLNADKLAYGVKEQRLPAVELRNRIDVVTAKMHAAYEERDRHVANENEFLARDWDMKASELDLLRVQLQNML